METICLKMESTLLKEIDSSMKMHRYSTRTEFIRDAIRAKLSSLEKEEAIRRLAAVKGSLKGNAKLNNEKLAGKLAVREILSEYNIKLD